MKMPHTYKLAVVRECGARIFEFSILTLHDEINHRQSHSTFASETMCVYTVKKIGIYFADAANISRINK